MAAATRMTVAETEIPRNKTRFLCTWPHPRGHVSSSCQNFLASAAFPQVGDIRNGLIWHELLIPPAEPRDPRAPAEAPKPANPNQGLHWKTISRSLVV
ncbi:hypothetical protein FRC0201_00153 [Corynebacterium diphtheriae]|nr:hypothetical protein FRC0026_01456 [Corynebacterium diphtheriae]CAB0785442.1 hypothetical protein FRC0201_00153 [Corynebacterium diphtheriae]CAB0982172.1 hypothetical protein FRC0507_00200 [Corynebacterium diphtheriae]